MLVLLSSTIILFADKNPQQLFENALSHIDQSVVKRSFEMIVAKYPDDYYGQKSLLELAKISLLKRDYEIAKNHLKKIYHPEITEKKNWLAKVYLQNDENDNAIISAQNYIFSSKDSEKIEVAYFIIAEAYIKQELYARALKNLENLRTSDHIKDNIPLLHYKIGYCYEKSGKFDSAVFSYKKLKRDFPYHHYCYLAEDRIFHLKREKKIDEINEDEVEHRNIESPKKETKISKGEYGTYLQIGAFGGKSNAEKYGRKIAKLGFEFIVFPKKSNGKNLFAVAVGPFTSDELKKAMSKLDKNEIKYFVVKR